ncbi:ABC-three component system protein [Dyadobacter sp. 50-39]|uniref:ABC-three component system protein n=1 Tax=Dyadobacter sp. 50-39 TaxID=1895756 RepID=UPI00095CCE7B|nr:ABC-three component system protein [Dyadobacter sp. 50-39]OJV17420.1 MAG: hypothetical protein BGO21_05085 [Dyadobacter sp. 50-39]
MESIFSANEPSLGYLYQIRYGLWLIVSAENREAKLFIEKFDDVSIDTPDAKNVYQTKLHIKSVANLTDASSDLWKTLRVWSEGISIGLLNPKTDFFNLVTTAKTSTDSIPYQLRQGTENERNINQILSSLVDVAKTSANIGNKQAYNSFLRLTEEQQKCLIQKITIVDASIDISETRTKILHELRLFSLKKESLYERLEGWFVGEIISQLLNQRNAISAKEVADKILDISDTFKSDNLPNDFNLPIVSDETQLASYRDKIFVKQVEIIGMSQKLINHAISDYHRAFSQKSKWIREGLISPLDEISYHQKLTEDWDRKFSILEECLTNDDEAVQGQKGRSFYETHYISHYPQIHIKDRFKEQYMVLGCCHMLSDKKIIGWHPDYINKIATDDTTKLGDQA